MGDMPEKAGEIKQGRYGPCSAVLLRGTPRKARAAPPVFPTAAPFRCPKPPKAKAPENQGLYRVSCEPLLQGARVLLP